MDRVLDYISFFEAFAKAHVDIAHLSEIDYQIPSSSSTVQNPENYTRFKATHMERVFNSLANDSDAKYKAFMFIEMYDFGPYMKNNEMEYNYDGINGTVSVVQEATEDDITDENYKLDICEGVIQDVMGYMKQVADYSNSNDCHPLFQQAKLASMKASPDFNLLDTNAHGYTLDFTIIQFRPSGIRTGKFLPDFLSDSIQQSPSPVSFTPLTPATGGTLTISGPNLAGTQEVRICAVPYVPANCFRYGPDDFQIVGVQNNIEFTLPSEITAGNYTVQVKTELGSWVAMNTLQVL